MKSIIEHIMKERVKINGYMFAVGDKFTTGVHICEVTKILEDTVVYSIRGSSFSVSLYTSMWNSDIRPHQ
jgi:hypothetical protein